MTKMYKIILLTLFAASLTFAQTYKVSGTVTSQQTGENLIGANVYVKGLAIGAATDANGKYEFNIPSGSYTIICSFIGFEAAQILDVDITNNLELDFQLKDYAYSLSVTVLADRAKERETPVAFTNLEKKDVEFKLGSQDIPMVLNTTPSVYATMTGGGAGDARINIRGFDQRNVAIMINGVPINDMENGWVYWSNWDGVGDATSSIQIQRGLSAVNLATPSIGGTMNVITDPTAAKFGGRFKQEFGDASFIKSTLSANSGLIDDTWAVSAVIVKKTGNGLIDATWTDAWAYYFGASYNLNATNRLELYALGAPQRHGQNSYAQNAAAYNQKYAREVLGYSQAALDKFPQASSGRFYNETWNNVSSDYTGQQWTTNLFGFSGSSASTQDRHDPDFINERENFFHKPIVNLNWYSTLSNNLNLYTTLYYSGGHGGGTGTFGDITWDYNSPSRIADWNKTIAVNRGSADRKGNAKTAGESNAILRNSRNDQWTVGLISKAYYKISDNFKTSFGIDWRTAEIDHYREVRDLLGGNYYSDNSDEFNPNRKLVLGDKFNYYNTNTVDWIGGYLQGEYSEDRWTVYGMGGYSTIKYTFVDHFQKGPDGGELTAEPDPIGGYQVKGGASFRLSNVSDLFANAGYVSKVPIFDQVVDDGTGIVSVDPQNELFTSYEAGWNYRSPDGKVALKTNVYYTLWLDRSNSRGVTNQDGSEGIVFISGLDSKHYGLEVEAALAPIKEARLDLSMSLGNWKYTSDVNAKYRDYSDANNPDQVYNLYVDGLRVGDQPQTGLAATLTIFPVEGLAVNGVVRHYRQYYANWDAFSRTNENDRQQSWKAPNYTVVDLHAAYDIPLDLGGVNLQLFGHVFNLFDEIYVQD
ncbi:MAG: TonB-dependent receptor, partial [Ignavibacteriae bacterium]|nr:TonB-dependent receptor [Ignavibacteriota bacterium]